MPCLFLPGSNFNRSAARKLHSLENYSCVQQRPWPGAQQQLASTHTSTPQVRTHRQTQQQARTPHTEARAHTANTQANAGGPDARIAGNGEGGRDTLMAASETPSTSETNPWGGSRHRRANPGSGGSGSNSAAYSYGHWRILHQICCTTNCVRE